MPSSPLTQSLMLTIAREERLYPCITIQGMEAEKVAVPTAPALARTRLLPCDWCHYSVHCLCQHWSLLPAALGATGGPGL